MTIDELRAMKIDELEMAIDELRARKIDELKDMITANTGVPKSILEKGLEESTAEEHCHEKAIIESAPHAIQRIRDEILEAKRRRND